MAREDIGFLAEMMNYPGVLAGDKEVMKKIKAAQRNGKPVDGHAPGLTGRQRDQYAGAGITTDHDVFLCISTKVDVGTEAGIHFLVSLIN